ncbi:MAG: ATP-binding protein [Thermoleophilia bacterium]|jgi:two-component system sensor histidine kinase/response regulator
MNDLRREVLRVAIVDDDAPLRQALKRILDRLHVHVEDVRVDVAYESTCFGDGESLLADVAEGAVFDIMLLDLSLPNISGLDVLAQLRDRGQNIVTVMIATFATPESAVKAMKLGAYDFLTKPFEPDKLCRSVQRATSQLIINREARRLAEEKRQVRFNFTSVLAHELKAPLNAVEGYLRILRVDEPPERQHMFDRSLLRLDGMRKLIFDLLDLARIESGQKQRYLQTVDVHALGRATIDLLAVEAAERGITVDLRPFGPVEMRADPDEIEIILNNLLSNAVKYNRDGGRVTVDMARVGQGIRITVSDTGIGLTPEESAQIFQEFVRIKNQDTIKVTGSGLGLSTVRKLAHLYGGDTSVKSERGTGSTFTVTLQDAGPEAPMTVTAATEGTPDGARKPDEPKMGKTRSSEDPDSR